MIRALRFETMRRRVLVRAYKHHITPWGDPPRPPVMSQTHHGHASACICSKRHLPRTNAAPVSYPGGLIPYLQRIPWGWTLGHLYIFLTGGPRPSGFTKIQKGSTPVEKVEILRIGSPPAQISHLMYARENWCLELRKAAPSRSGDCHFR